jgi:hypothetical protein
VPVRTVLRDGADCAGTGAHQVVLRVVFQQMLCRNACCRLLSLAVPAAQVRAGYLLLGDFDAIELAFLEQEVVDFLDGAT